MTLKRTTDGDLTMTFDNREARRLVDRLTEALSRDTTGYFKDERDMRDELVMALRFPNAYK